MSYKECKNVLGELVAEGKIAASEVAAIVERVAERGRKAAQRGENGMAATQKEVADMANAEIHRLLERQRRLVLEKVVRTQFDATLPNFKNNAEAFEAFLVQSQRVREGGKRSISSEQRAHASARLAMLDADLRQAGVYEIMRRGLLQREVIDDLIAIRKARLTQSEARSVSGNEDAFKLAQILAKHAEETRLEQNLYGADISYRHDYVVRNAHDADKIRKAGFEKWRQDLETFGLLNKEAFQKADEALEMSLRGTYDGIVSGNHVTHRAAVDEGDALPFIKRRSLAESRGHERVFHLKPSADAWMKYSELYGKGDLYSIFRNSLEHDARTTALLRRAGPQGGQFLRALRDDLVAKNQGNVEVISQLKSFTTDNQIAEVDGSANLVKSHNLHKATFVVKALNQMHDLGSSLWASAADLTNASLQLQHVFGTNKNLMQLHADTLGQIMRGGTAEEGQAIARMSHVGSESFSGAVLSRFMEGDRLDGKFSKFSSRVANATLLPQWTSEGKQAVAAMFSNMLGHNHHLPYAALDANLQRAFSEYGISPQFWDAMRKNVWGQETMRHAPERLGDKAGAYGGLKFITADSVSEISDDAVKSLMPKGVSVTESNVRRFRDELQSTFDNFANDTASRSFITDSARGRALRQMGTTKGTALNSAVSLVMQYKAYAMEFTMQTLARETYGQGVESSLSRHPLKFAKEYGQIVGKQLGKGQVPTPVKLLVGMTLMGAFGMMTSNAFKGLKTDFTKSETWKSAFLKGGGLGMYGDFLFANYDAYGNNFLTKSLGPSATRISDAATLFAKMRTFDASTGDQLAKIVENETPFLNLFYTKFATDYLFLHQLHEALQPGKLRRLERLNEERGKGFIVPPSEVIDYGGMGTPGQGIQALPMVPGRLAEAAAP